MTTASTRNALKTFYADMRFVGSTVLPVALGLIAGALIVVIGSPA